MTQGSSTPEPSPSTAPADQGLQALIGSFPEPEFEQLRRYAELTSMGQHDEASQALKTFIAEASGWDVRKRRQAAVRIADVAETYGAGPGSRVLPNRLWNDLVEPTLKRWAEEDDVALPHRLLALVDWPSYLHLRRAHDLDPDDQLVANRLAATLIRDVRFSRSHLGEIDIAKLEEAEALVAALQDDEARQSLAADLDGLRQITEQERDIASHKNPTT